MMAGFDLAEFATILGVFTIAAVTPGADFACVVRESITFGRRAGVLSALGVASAILVHASYTVLGVGLVISQSILAFNIIKWAGVGYLVFIGIMSLRSGPTSLAIDEPSERTERPVARSVGVGFLTNLLNPKATLFFVSLFTAIVSHETPAAIQFGYGCAMALVLAAWFSLVAIFFTTNSMRSAFVRFGHWFNRITGLVFIALGVRLALQRAT